MGKFVEVGKTGDLADGTMKEVSIQERNILLARVGGKLYAAENVCPHMGAKLSQGKLEGTVVTCPRHGSQFDLGDGHVIRWTNFPGPVSAFARVIKKPRSLKTYLIKAQGDKVLVEL
ncbi:MAG TPA: Rieske 2Fe-2S domain-containing protein [Dehalococcoidia bacterium]|nr:Rieske 2Fe-2S domain-containing protein [Dehalococcoidia bacterium]